MNFFLILNRPSLPLSCACCLVYVCRCGGWEQLFTGMDWCLPGLIFRPFRLQFCSIEHVWRMYEGDVLTRAGVIPAGDLCSPFSSPLASHLHFLLSLLPMHLTSLLSYYQLTPLHLSPFPLHPTILTPQPSPLHPTILTPRPSFPLHPTTTSPSFPLHHFAHLILSIHDISTWLTHSYSMFGNSLVSGY